MRPLGRVRSGAAIIGRTERAQLLDHLRDERARVLQAQATFEHLTQREALVLASLADGLNADEIARQHFVALTTVRSQIRAVLQKLGERSQLAAVALADAHRDLLPYESSTTRDRRRTTQGWRAAARTSTFVRPEARSEIRNLLRHGRARPPAFRRSAEARTSNATARHGRECT